MNANFLVALTTTRNFVSSPRLRGSRSKASLVKATKHRGFDESNAQNIGDVKIKLHRPINGEIKTLIIRRQADGWFACFSCECGCELHRDVNAAINILVKPTKKVLLLLWHNNCFIYVRKAHLFVRWTRQDSTRIQALMSTRHKARPRLTV
jgi:transposase